MSRLKHGRIECLPLVHGRTVFATEVRRRLLEESFAAVAVELPPGLKRSMLQAVQELPRISVVWYREQPQFLAPEAPAFYVPVQPADGIVEALRIARNERLPIYFIDAELRDFHALGLNLPDPQGLSTLGMERWYESCLPLLKRHPRRPQDETRELHMAARLQDLSRKVDGKILLVCGMAHWERIRAYLSNNRGEIWKEDAIPPEQIRILHPIMQSLPFLMGEMPFMVEGYERHRQGIDLEPFDAVEHLKKLLLQARIHHEKNYPGTLEVAEPHALRTLLDFARKMTVRRGHLLPDSYTLVVAANGVVGNDYALSLLETAHEYSWNKNIQGEDPEEDFAEASTPDPVDNPPGTDPDVHPVAIHETHGLLDDQEVEVRNRTPGSSFQYGRLQLERPPDARQSRDWQADWDPHSQCSWPPEDIVIENFRDYVGKRALSLARVKRTRVEPFVTSLLDGIDFRESLRDVVEQRLFVREEPRMPGGVGGLVTIFEEDAFGIRYPWRSTWMAEHHNESTLAFYATDFRENLIGPGVARSHYGGYMLVYPPLAMPDIWQDPRFERARTPSERLLLATIYWAQEHYIVHLAQKPPHAGLQAEAKRRKKHILHLPLNTFSKRTLERIRRLHVLNGQEVRSWAARFIR